MQFSNVSVIKYDDSKRVENLNMYLIGNNKE